MTRPNCTGLCDFYLRFLEDDLTLAYYGTFSDVIIDKIIELSEEYLVRHHLKKFKYKVGYLIAECFQNVARHGNINDPDNPVLHNKNGFFIRIKNNICYVAAVNLIPNEIISQLENKINNLNQLDKNSLDALYKMILFNGEFSEKGGAGLGLIDMSRKTGKNLFYSFEPVSDSHSFFYIMLYLDPVQDNSESEEEKNIFSEIKILHNQLTELNQYILFKCDFSEGMIFPVINMIENNMDAEVDHYPTKWRIYHCTVEIMQNIHHHGIAEDDKKIGLFSFGRNMEGYTLNSINPVAPDQKIKIIRLLDDLEGNSKEEINRKYREQLNVKLADNDVTAGLGFIDMAKLCKRQDYQFKVLEDGTYLFDYKVTI